MACTLQACYVAVAMVCDVIHNFFLLSEVTVYKRLVHAFFLFCDLTPLYYLQTGVFIKHVPLPDMDVVILFFIQ